MNGSSKSFDEYWKDSSDKSPEGILKIHALNLIFNNPITYTYAKHYPMGKTSHLEADPPHMVFSYLVEEKRTQKKIFLGKANDNEVLIPHYLPDGVISLTGTKKTAGYRD